jgi:hypothetical protein
MGDSIEQKREDVLRDIDELLGQIEEVSGYQPDHVRANVTRAREQLLDDGEYNYNVRLALLQLQNHLEGFGESSPYAEVLEKATELRDSLSQRAELPPADEISR